MIQPDLLGLLRGDFGRAKFVNDGFADRFRAIRSAGK